MRRPVIRSILAVVFLLWWFASLWWWALFGMADQVITAHIISLLLLGVLIADPAWKD